MNSSLFVLFGVIVFAKFALIKPQQQGSSLTQIETAEANKRADKTTKFKSLPNELRSKLNKARNDLKAAKQYVALAEKAAALNHRGTTAEKAVKDIIAKTEIVLVHAGEKMGLDYVHYKRSVGDEGPWDR
ncbi:uncharacterized protein LOC5511498 [Nematostella vectensis]|uniref:uncharacterized protein LOC5511498 n=1 Tax=Nematostella vectensis TaxID=45351 RepID=UPI0020770111|nr:uncharacterized protein LOC5511498 [Nematostella vectensis]